MVEQLFGQDACKAATAVLMATRTVRSMSAKFLAKIDEQINSVRRELSNLLSIGIIVSDNTNNRLYYEVNQKHEL